MEDGKFNTGFPLEVYSNWPRNGTGESVLILYVICKQIHIKHHFEQISSEKAFPLLPAMGPISFSSLYETSLGSPF